MFTINYLAVLIAAFANFFIGFMFHGPLFGKLWMKLANIRPTGKEKMSDMFPQMISNFVVNFIFAYALAVIYLLASTSSVASGPGILTGLMCAFGVWLGFMLTTTSIEVIWMGRNYKLWLFELVSSLVCCLAMGTIIAAF